MRIRHSGFKTLQQEAFMIHNIAIIVRATVLGSRRYIYIYIYIYIKTSEPKYYMGADVCEYYMKNGVT